MKRECGNCTMCCKLVPLNDVPAGQWCQHCAVGKGCGIYAERPEICRAFSCAWLLDEDRVLFSDEERPDKTRIVTVIYRHSAFPGGLWVLLEGRPGALGSDHVKALKLALAASGRTTVAVHHDGREEIFGRRCDIEQAAALVAQAKTLMNP